STPFAENGRSFERVGSVSCEAGRLTIRRPRAPATLRRVGRVSTPVMPSWLEESAPWTLAPPTVRVPREEGRLPCAPLRAGVVPVAGWHFRNAGWLPRQCFPGPGARHLFPSPAKP